jgi:DNA polymerase
MTPIEYVLDRRFEMICCGVAVNDGTPILLPQEEVIDFLHYHKRKHGDYIAISHNALFDMAILAYRYRIRPSIMIDTMAMVRAALVYRIPNGRVSLAAILDFLGLEKKLSTIQEVEGLHFDDIKRVPDLWMRFCTYTLRDTNGCREIFQRLAPNFKSQEFRIMDTVIRMATEMKLLVDNIKLTEHYNEVMAKENATLERFKYERAQFLSADKFAELLRERGIDPPKKWSARTKKEIYAFAKTDEGMVELLNHEDEEIRALISGRLGIKSTIEQTRTRRFLSISFATGTYYGQSWVPVPLKYSGAHTHRLSGDWQLNMQNLSNRKNRKMRSALYAPSGYIILAVDASQIEARLTAWLAQQVSLLQMFKDRIDIYKDFAADIYGITIDSVNKIQRFNGKTCILGLGFGMGDKRLLFTLTTGARDNLGVEIIYSLDDCTKWVNRFRTRFDRIPDLWDRAQNAVFHMAQGMGNAEGWEFGPCRIEGTSVALPNGLHIHYHNLHRDAETGKYIYQYGREIKQIYGGKFIENIVQYLDRQHVFEAALRTEERCAKIGIPNVRICLQVHDENVYCIRKEHLDVVRQIALEEMSRTPQWGLPSKDYPFELPLAAEAKIGANYGELE